MTGATSEVATTTAAAAAESAAACVEFDDRPPPAVVVTAVSAAVADDEADGDAMLRAMQRRQADRVSGTDKANATSVTRAVIDRPAQCQYCSRTTASE